MRHKFHAASLASRDPLQPSWYTFKSVRNQLDLVGLQRALDPLPMPHRGK